MVMDKKSRNLPLSPHAWRESAEQLTNDIMRSMDVVLLDNPAPMPRSHPGIYQTAYHMCQKVNYHVSSVENAIDSIKRLSIDEVQGQDDIVAQEWIQQSSMEQNTTVKAHSILSSAKRNSNHMVPPLSFEQAYVSLVLMGHFADTGTLQPLLQRMYATQEQVNTSFLQHAKITVARETTRYEDTRTLMLLYFMAAFHEVIRHYDPNAPHEWQFPLIALRTVDLWTDDVQQSIHDTILSHYLSAFREQEQQRASLAAAILAGLDDEA